MSPALTGRFFTISSIWCTDISPMMTYDIWQLFCDSWRMTPNFWSMTSDLRSLTFDPGPLTQHILSLAFRPLIFDPQWSKLFWLVNRSSCAQCTVRLNKPQTLEFGAEKGLLQGDTKLWTPQSVSAKHFKSPGVGQVSSSLKGQQLEALDLWVLTLELWPLKVKVKSLNRVQLFATP